MKTAKGLFLFFSFFFLFYIDLCSTQLSISPTFKPTLATFSISFPDNICWYPKIISFPQDKLWETPFYLLSNHMFRLDIRKCLKSHLSHYSTTTYGLEVHRRQNALTFVAVLPLAVSVTLSEGESFHSFEYQFPWLQNGTDTTTAVVGLSQDPVRAFTWYTRFPVHRELINVLFPAITYPLNFMNKVKS